MRHEARGKGVEGGLQARADSGSRSSRSSGTTRACKTGVQLDAQHAARRRCDDAGRPEKSLLWDSKILDILALAAHTHST